MQELPASTDPEVRNAWSRCVTQLQEIVAQHFSRLHLADKPIKSVESITPVELEEINNMIRSLFPEIDLTNLTKQGLKNVRSYHRWVEKHCRMRVYSFQIKKCCDVTCRRNNEEINTPWLPDPKVTDDSDRPSATPVRQKPTRKNPAECDMATETDKTPSQSQPAKKKQKKHEDTITLDPSVGPKCDPHMFTTQHAQHLIQCIKCNEPRVVYVKHRLTTRTQMMLTVILDEYECYCGGEIIPPGHTLSGVCFVRTKMTCADPVELSYYGSCHGRTDICRTA